MVFAAWFESLVWRQYAVCRLPSEDGCHGSPGGSRQHQVWETRGGTRSLSRKHRCVVLPFTVLPENLEKCCIKLVHHWSVSSAGCGVSVVLR